MLNTVKELFRYRHLLQYMIAYDLRIRYRDSFFGFLWTLLHPLLLMLVMWAVFSRVGRMKEENYALFLLSGLMTWTFFSQSVERSLSSIVGNRGLMQKIYLPKLIFPVSMVTSNLINLGFFFLAYVLIAALAAHNLSPTLLLVLPAIAMLYMLGTGAALLMSTLNVFFRDFAHLTSVLLRAMFYLTPIIYAPNMLGAKFQALLRFNPMYYPVVIIREALYYGRMPDPQLWAIGWACSITMLVIGLLAFSSFEDKFVYYA